MADLVNGTRELPDLAARIILKPWPSAAREIKDHRIRRPQAVSTNRYGMLCEVAKLTRHYQRELGR